MSYTQVDSTIPGHTAVAVTPNDTTTFNACTRALFVGVQGDVTVDMAKVGTNITFKNAVGILPIQVTRVYATNTTATNILAIS